MPGLLYLDKRKPIPGEWEYDMHPGPYTQNDFYDPVYEAPLYQGERGGFLSDWFPYEPIPYEPIPYEPTPTTPLPTDPGEFFPIDDPSWDTTAVYPKGDSIFTTKTMIRDGPFVYESSTPGHDDHVGLLNNNRNPFYNLDDDFSKTKFNERWVSGLNPASGRILPSSYESYIVPFADITGYPGPRSTWSVEGMPREYEPVVSGVIPSWYGLDIHSFGGYGDENKYWNTPEGQYTPDDFRWQYAGGPSFVEGAYLGPSPGLSGLDDAGNPHQGWIPGVDARRGWVNVPSDWYAGEPRIMWGSDGEGYWIEGQSDIDKYGLNHSPLNNDGLLGIVGGGLIPDAGPISDSPYPTD